jgi:aryl-alcohol dehydrogenase-like predicted oxidoreductase
MPMGETLKALDDLVREGKVRFTAGCNFEAWRLVDSHWIGRQNNFVPLTASQFAYSMMARSAEKEMIPACRQLGIGVIPYLPLAAGLLTGKVSKNGTPPSNTRLAIEQHTAERWITPRNLELVRVLDDWARDRGHSVTELALAWLLAEPIVATVIAGASSPAQIRQNVQASEWRLTSDEHNEVNKILDDNPPENSGDYYSAAGYFDAPTEMTPKIK